MSKRFACPHCGEEILTFLKVGEHAKCPRCGIASPVPEDAEPTGEAPEWVPRPAPSRAVPAAAEDGDEAEEPEDHRWSVVKELEKALGRSLLPETASELAEEIAARVGAAERGPPLRETSGQIARTALHEVTGRTSAEMDDRTPLGEILPAVRRRALWSKLGASLGVELPELERPCALTLLVLLAGVAGFVFALVTDRGFWAGAGIAVGLWSVLALLTRPLRLSFPTGVQTVGGLTDHLVLEVPGEIRGEGVPWSREQIHDLVLAAVRKVLGKEEADGETRLLEEPKE